MRRSVLTTSGLAAAIVAALQSSVPAHEGATGVVKERMDAMETMANAMKAITQRIKTNQNLSSVKNDALRIHDLAEKVTTLFPPGTAGHPSGAKPTAEASTRMRLPVRDLFDLDQGRCLASGRQ